MSLPSTTIDKLSYSVIDDIYVQKDNISFVVNTLSGTEFSLALIEEINQFIKNNPGIHLSVFNSNKELPILIPNFGIFHTLELNSCLNPVIACDLPSWQSCLIAPSQKKYLWIYDLPAALALPKEVVARVNDTKFTIFTRNKQYNNALKKHGFVTSNFWIENIDLAKIRSFIYENNI